MDLRAKLAEKVGNYCFVQKTDAIVVIRFPPPNYCRTNKEAVEFTERGRFGMPGKISDVGDDYVAVKYFDKFGEGFAGVSSDTFSLRLVQMREMG
jgi:hypothetical protein